MDDGRNLKIMIVAGEVSGDLQAGMLARSIKELAPDARLFGMGGQRMKDAGVDVRFDVMKQASIGIWENAKNYLFTVRAVFNKVKAEVEKEKPDCIVLVDYQGFNLALAKFAKEKGIPVVYYIPPQYWAWRTGQAKNVARLVDEIIAIFPEEEEAYRKAGAKVTFVGNPLLEKVKVSGSKEEIRKSLGVKPDEKMLALLPGSRFSELRSLLPAMLEAAKILKNRLPSLQVFIPLAAPYLKDEIEKKVKISRVDAQIIEGRNYDVLSASDFAIICSGIATLEAAILGTPMVVAYKVSFLTYLAAKVFIQIPYISLPNILTKKMIVPELLQDKANGNTIAETVYAIMQDSARTDTMKAEYRVAVARLGSPGASLRAAEVVLRVGRRQ